MSVSMRQMVIPAYLFLCLLLGGSSQAVWGNMLLQLGGLAIIAWALAERAQDTMVPAARHVLWIALAAIAVGLLQLVPLPPSIWILGPAGRPKSIRSRVPLPACRFADSVRDDRHRLAAIPPLRFSWNRRLKAVPMAYAAAPISPPHARIRLRRCSIVGRRAARPGISIR